MVVYVNVSGKTNPRIVSTANIGTGRLSCWLVAYHWRHSVGCAYWCLFVTFRL